MTVNDFRFWIRYGRRQKARGAEEATWSKLNAQLDAFERRALKKATVLALFAIAVLVWWLHR